MADPITPERLAEIRKLADAATPGPWTVYEYCDGVCFGVGADYITDGWRRIHDTAFQREDDGPSDIVDCDRREQNATFVAAARAAVPELLVEVERLRAEVDRYDTLTTELLRDLDETVAYPVLAWIYRASALTDEWTGWRHPVSLGTDIQDGRDWRTLMVRVPFDRYVIVRLWPFRWDGV